METWEEKWKTTRNGRSYQGAPSRKMTPAITTTTRAIEAVATRVITGHGFTRSYLHQIPATKITRPKCPCRQGGSDQTAEHLILYCQSDNLPAMRGKLQKAIAPMHLAWGTVMHAKKGLTAAIEHLIAPSGIGTRRWMTDSGREDEKEAGRNRGRGRRGDGGGGG